MQLLLLRHGDAERLAPTDAERPLTAAGTEEVRRAARAGIAHGLTLDRVLVSPYRRAQQSAALLGSEFGVNDIRTTPALVPEADPEELLRHLDLGPGTTALVGHEPLLGRLLGLLLTGGRGRSIPLTTGMIVAVEFESRASLLGQLRFAWAP